MKFFIITSLLFWLHFDLFAQIPNGGFEFWEQMQNFEKPLLWNTNQDSNYVRFIKDTDVYEGNYSLKIVGSSNATGWNNCNSQAQMGMNFDIPLQMDKSLTFYVKCIPDSTKALSGSYLIIEGSLYSGSELKGKIKWQADAPIYTYTKIQIPIQEPNIDSINIVILGGAANGADDGCYDYSISWIDGLSIAPTTLVTTKESIPFEKSISIFPNPSSGRVELANSKTFFSTYMLYSLEGKLLENGKVHQNTIQLNPIYHGTFILELMDDEGSKIHKKLILE